MPSSRLSWCADIYQLDELLYTVIWSVFFILNYQGFVCLTLAFFVVAVLDLPYLPHLLSSKVPGSERLQEMPWIVATNSVLPLYRVPRLPLHTERRLKLFLVWHSFCI